MAGKFGRRARRLTLAGLALGAATLNGALAQAPHPIPPLARPLHERAAEAELIAIGRVTRVERGRIAIATGSALRGAPPAALELKRSPLAPPPLAEGDVTLLFLRGARAPYVLAGAPNEALRIAAGADAEALAAALPALLAAGEDAAALRAAYEAWAASESALVRALGHAGLESIPPPAGQPATAPPGA